MKSLNSSTIKKIIYGILVTDGYSSDGRFDLFTKSKQYADFVTDVLNQLTHTKATCYYKEDKRKKEYGGYRVFTNKSEYIYKIEKHIYNERKYLSRYVCDRLSPVSFAHMWMCDGYLEHNKNRKENKVQNIGWFCLEKYPQEELVLFQDKLLKYDIISTQVDKPWGFGKRLKISGMNLQKFISLIFPHILSDFSYKTNLYYAPNTTYVDVNLPNAEQYLKYYTNIEDIVRHSW